jgi:hypothetical protein
MATLLVVDDGRDIRDLLVERLMRVGHEADFGSPRGGRRAGRPGSFAPPQRTPSRRRARQSPPAVTIGS